MNLALSPTLGSRYLQLIRSVCAQVLSHVYTELKVSTSVETSILTVHEDGGLVVNSTKVQDDVVAARP